MKWGARAALVLLVLVHVAALAADWVAPYEPETMLRSRPYEPPTRLRWREPGGDWHLWPFVYARQPEPGASRRYVETRERRYPLRLFVRGEEGVRLFGVETPATLHLLGTDRYGRDRFSRLVHGGRISLFAGLLAASASVGLGLALGALAGFYGGRVDDALMRLAELFMALPWLYLLFGVRAFLPLDVSAAQAFMLFIALVGIIGWARPARLFRGVVLSAVERDYVLAARAAGAGDLRLLAAHVLPETWSVALVQFALLVPQYILAEVTLSFLGLGVPPSTPSWGALLDEASEIRVMVEYGWMFLPALALILVVLCYQHLGGALQERFAAGEAGPR